MRYETQKKQLFGKMIPKAILNLLCLAVVIFLLHGIPGTLAHFGEVSGYGDGITYDVLQKPPYGGTVQAESGLEETPVEEKWITITDIKANIRSGPGVDYEVITTADQGARFKATGNQKEASNGRPWYEIYLDDAGTETGWVSEKVMTMEE